MRSARLAGLILGLTLIPLLAACSPTSSGTTGASTGPTPTPTPPCPTHATTTAEAWDKSGQVIGTIGGSAPATLSDFHYPLGLPSEMFFGSEGAAPGFITWAPDAHHLAVAITVEVPFAYELFPYVVDTSTHAVTRVPLPASGSTPGYITVPTSDTWAQERLFAWADDHTLLIFAGQRGSGGSLSSTTGAPTHSYDIATGALSTVPNVLGAVQGEVRCTTLFYMITSEPAPTGPTGYSQGYAKLFRYDLTSHTQIGDSTVLGDTEAYAGGEGSLNAMGWDVSPDGAKLVVQKTTAHPGPGEITISSQFQLISFTGGSPVTILPRATSGADADITISPDGTKVAVTNANPTPNVLSGNIDGSGVTTFYSPDAAMTPAWLPDSTSFHATAGDLSHPSVEQYTLGTPLGPGGRAPGSVKYDDAAWPATLP